ncbi:MAG TPA: hypothetical protein VNO30_45420 [Kofleriaceae bacterium]|nr:hypothetical protein [Kofleriaceae bacterium]
MTALCRHRTLVVQVLLLASCGHGETSDDAQAPDCLVEATTSYAPQANVVTGKGIISCDIAANLSLYVCIYSKGTAETDWGPPLQCKTTGGSGQTTLSSEIPIAIVGPTPNDYRTVVNTQLNLADQPAETSPTVTAP